MKTITIIAGNSDNKLPQNQWAQLTRQLYQRIACRANGFEFEGGPATDSPFQNYAWIIRINDDQAVALQEEIKAVREHFRQDSVAWIEGVTKFV